MFQKHSNSSDEAVLLAGIPAPSRSGPAAGIPVISILRAESRRPEGSEDASSPDWDVPPTIGELAVRLVANFRLPSCKLLRLDQRGK
nr:hypothetical protein [Rhizobium leguminosarum]